MDIVSLTVAQIKELAGRNGCPTGELLQAMALDKRSAAQTLYRHYVSVRQKQDANVQRLDDSPFGW